MLYHPWMNNHWKIKTFKILVFPFFKVGNKLESSVYQLRCGSYQWVTGRPWVRIHDHQERDRIFTQESNSNGFLYFPTNKSHHNINGCLILNIFSSFPYHVSIMFQHDVGASQSLTTDSTAWRRQGITPGRRGMTTIRSVHGSSLWVAVLFVLSFFHCLLVCIILMSLFRLLMSYPHQK